VAAWRLCREGQKVGAQGRSCSCAAGDRSHPAAGTIPIVVFASMADLVIEVLPMEKHEAN